MLLLLLLILKRGPLFPHFPSLRIPFMVWSAFGFAAQVWLQSGCSTCAHPLEAIPLSLSLSLLYTQTFLPIAVLTVHFLMTPSFPFFLCFIITASSHSRRPCQTGGEKEEVTVADSSAEDGILQSTFQTNHSCNEHQPARTALERPEDCLAGCAVLCPRTALRFSR